MDAAIVISSAIQLVITMNKLAGGSFPDSKKHLASVLGELKVLRAILGEAIQMMKSTTGPLPESASVASERCVELEKMLNETLRFLGFTVPDDEIQLKSKKSKKYKTCIIHLRRLSYEEELRQIMQSFRAAVLLLRDITTE